MNKLVIVLLLALVALAAAAKVHPYQKFKAFKVQYDKVYKSDEEELMRFKIFMSNLERIEKMNKKTNGRNNFGVTKFADLTPSEFSHLYLMPKRPLPEKDPQRLLSFTPMDKDKVPSSFDWRSKGAVTAVYNQGQCGSCWAFSATEQTESMNFIDGTVKCGSGPCHLAMQQIVDCDNQAYGCQGGWTYSAYNYLEGVGGLEALQDYPYVAENEQCRFNKADLEADISTWGYVTQSEDEDTMLQYVASSGPLSICADAQSWQYYQGGVISANNCGTQIDHCIQITGYSTQDGVPAWNVRNSWGTNWGDNGYLYLERNQDTCGCAQVVTSVHGKGV